MAVTSTKFNPLSLDAINFLLADVRGAVGPYLNVFLVTQQHWSQSQAWQAEDCGRQMTLESRFCCARQR